MNAKQNQLFGAVALALTVCGAMTPVAAAAQAHSKTAVSRFAPAIAPVIATSAPGVSLKPDQVNTSGWDKAWTNLVNDAQQSFTPSMPKLMAVEVELVVGNPGPPEDELTLTVLDSTGQELASVTQLVPASDCEHTMFMISKDGIDVQPGQTYRIKLTGGILFGWKYVVGGYKKGAATFNGKPLLPGARSTFLFQTFGAE
jgi:hypothetical protein